MRPADDRRIPGWRQLREYLAPSEHSPSLHISSECKELIRCLPALLYDKSRIEDASSEPHSVTHAPEALRYAFMTRFSLPQEEKELPFFFPKREKRKLFD